MFKQLFLLALAAAGVVNAEDQPRRMTVVGGGAPDRGKCTLEVVVDGAAEVEIRGDTATLRNLGGETPRWKRFQCTGPLPRNPGDFRFAGVDGRGRQQLMRDPRSGGLAVIRIEDSHGGSEGYTFDIMWSNARPMSDQGPDRGFDRDSDRYYRDREETFRGNAWRTRLFTHIREDLEQVQRVTFPFGGDQYRLEQTKRQLDQLQDLLAHRRYDRRELDDVTRALRRVLEDNKLMPKDREILNDDLNRLLDFRDHMRDYGVR
jgi:hypothetical protein